MLGGTKVTSDVWLVVLDYFYKSKAVFFCDSCESDFESITTPTNCPKCGASPGPLAVELDHKGYVAKTFPFSGPEERDKLRRLQPV